MSLTNSNIKIHPLADVQSSQIGEDTTFWQFCVILAGAKVGANCNINALTVIENDVIIGDNVTVKSGVQVWDGLHIDNNVFIRPNVTFTNDFTPRCKQSPTQLLKTVMDDNASIGANSTPIGELWVGAYAVIVAGGVVTKNVPEYSLVYGNPAQVRGCVGVYGCQLNRTTVNDVYDFASVVA
tara:strand:- start:79 stop:624 length:546 start_codon:yes stop_codon:yes gene_type:complete